MVPRTVSALTGIMPCCHSTYCSVGFGLNEYRLTTVWYSNVSYLINCFEVMAGEFRMNID